MISTFMNSVMDPEFLIVLLTGVAVFATFFTLLMPYLAGTTLDNRMKTVALERDSIKARERARMAADADRRRKGGGSLKEGSHKRGVLAIVDGLDLKKALADENTLNKLRMAGFRGQNPLIMFLFLRFVLPFIAFIGALAYVFGLNAMPEHSTMMKVFTCICVAYAGFYAPNLYITNRASKRKQSISRAWPDALDLLLICVEFGFQQKLDFAKFPTKLAVNLLNLQKKWFSQRRNYRSCQSVARHLRILQIAPVWIP